MIRDSRFEIEALPGGVSAGFEVEFSENFGDVEIGFGSVCRLPRRVKAVRLAAFDAEQVQSPYIAGIKRC